MHVVYTFNLYFAGEIFLPLYTGKVIDGIVVEKDESEFTKSIIIMSAIAITR